MGWRATFHQVLRSHYPMASDGYPELSSAAVLSWPIGSKVFIKRGRKRISPCINGILVGESSTTMKSSVIDFAHQVLLNAVVKNFPDVDFSIRNPAGTESFEKQLSRKAKDGDQFFWFHSEIGTLFATMGKDFGSGIADDLCLLFDNDSLDKLYSQQDKDIHIPPLYISSLWGCTPSVAIDYLKPVHADQGYLQRPAVVFGVPRRPTISLPTVTPQMDSDFAQLCSDYSVAMPNLITGKCEHILHPDAKNLLDLWEKDLDDRIDKGQLDGAAAKRGIILALKLAVINEYDGLSFCPNPNTIEMPEMDAAIKEAEVYINGAQELRSIISDQPDCSKVKYFVRKVGEVDEMEILKSCHVEPKRLEEIRVYLKRMKLIRYNSSTWKWVK